MSEEYFCEYCGLYSTSQERCTRCGRDIADLFKNPSYFRIPAWGRVTLRLMNPVEASHVWREIAEAWQEWEDKTNLGLLASQVEKFNTQADFLELYGSELEASMLKKILNGRGTIEFEELPDEAIPSRPRAPRPAHWRKPYVPRRRR